MDGLKVEQENRATAIFDAVLVKLQKDGGRSGDDVRSRVLDQLELTDGLQRETKEKIGWM